MALTIAPAPSAPPSRLTAFARTVLVLTAPSMVALIPVAVIAALPAMAATFSKSHDGPFFAQMIMAMPALMLIIGAPLASISCERYGVRPTFIGAALLYTLSGSAGLYLDGFEALSVSRLALGLSGGALQTCSLALAGRWYHANERDRILGLIVSISSATAIAGLVIGGQLVDIFGWRGPFLLYLLGLPVFLLVMFAVEPAGPKSSTNTCQPGYQMLKPLVIYYALILVLTLAMFMPGIQGPFLISNNAKISAFASGMIIAACPLGAILSSACFAALRRRIGSRPILAMTALLMGAGCLISTQADTLLLVIAGFGIIGLGAGLMEPNIGSVILGRTPHILHARASSLMISAMFAGQFLNPLVANPLRSAFGPNGAFFGIGLATLLLGIFIILSHSIFPKDQPIVTGHD